MLINPPSNFVDVNDPLLLPARPEEEDGITPFEMEQNLIERQMFLQAEENQLEEILSRYLL